MSIKLGNITIGSLYLGSTKISEAYLGNVKILNSGLPAIGQKTLRFDFSVDHFDPVTFFDPNNAPDTNAATAWTNAANAGLTWTHVTGDIYDFTYNNTAWYNTSTSGLFNKYSYKSGSKTIYPMSSAITVCDVIDSDLTGVTDVNRLFNSCPKVRNCVLKNTGSIANAQSLFYNGSIQLETINALDLSSATNINSLFRNCKYLTSPLSITLSGAVKDCGYAFYNCWDVPSGALALYNNLSGQTNIPTTYGSCFTNCGANTTTGAAELAQIPSSWGGTGA